MDLYNSRITAPAWRLSAPRSQHNQCFIEEREDPRPGARGEKRVTIRGCAKLLRKPFSIVAHKATSHREYVPGTITCVSTKDPVAALTFDDGPDPNYTPRLLDVLRRYQAQATFFMIGEAAHKYPQLVRRVAQEGHAIGNHSWDHRFFPSLPGRERRQQIRACECALAPYMQRFFRPPYGAQSLASRVDALRLGYKVVAWNLDVKDWRDNDAERVAERLYVGVRPGSIVLLHDAIYRSQLAVPL